VVLRDKRSISAQRICGRGGPNTCAEGHQLRTALRRQDAFTVPGWVRSRHSTERFLRHQAGLTVAVFSSALLQATQGQTDTRLTPHNQSPLSRLTHSFIPPCRRPSPARAPRLDPVSTPVSKLFPSASMSLMISATTIGFASARAGAFEAALEKNLKASRDPARITPLG
jgi:hypothetical protein